MQSDPNTRLRYQLVARCRQHGITLERYEEILASQNGVCAICRKAETQKNLRTGQVRNLSLDHDHNCCPGSFGCAKCIRGLLCSKCNISLGSLWGNFGLLENAVKYLSESQKARYKVNLFRNAVDYLSESRPKGMLEEKPRLCALYARVSTDDQNCDLQLQEMRSYCERRGWPIHGEYVDLGWSGSKRDRPQLGKLMRDAKQHRFDCIICWKLDRFGRSVANFVENLQQLDMWGVRFLVITQAIDTDQQNPSSRLLMCILAAVAEFERSMIVERVKAGMAAAKRRGVHCGRKALVFDRRKVLELHLRGKSLRAIAREVKVSQALVHKIVKRGAA